MGYVELHAHSAFTFLEGASLPEQLVERATDLGLEALAITDRDDVGGHVRLVEAADKTGVRPIFGAELTVRATPLLDGTRLVKGSDGVPGYAMGRDLFGVVLLAKDAEGWGNLSALITKGRFERPRGRPYVTIEEIAQHKKGLVALTAFLDGPLAPALRAGDVAEAERLVAPWLELFEDDLVLEVQDHALPEERLGTKTTLALARRIGNLVVATNHVHHVTRALKPVEDVLRCVKHECTVDDAGDRLFPNDLRHLASAREMERRFRGRPDVVRATVEVAERCTFHLKRDLKAPLPCFPEIRAGEDADATLERLAWEGARIRYPTAFESSAGEVAFTGFDASVALPMKEKVHAQIRHELDLVRRLQFAGYFLVLYEVVLAAKKLGILVQGRGSAANSALCYCLGITAIDPIGRGMLFERFLAEGRAEPPDIDLDIEHERREELLQHVYERYGRNHAAMVAAIHTFQPRAAARDVARVLGLSVEQGNALAGLCDRFIGMEPWGGSHRTGAAAPHGAQDTDLRRGGEKFRDGEEATAFREHPRETVRKSIARDEKKELRKKEERRRDETLVILREKVVSPHDDMVLVPPMPNLHADVSRANETPEAVSSRPKEYTHESAPGDGYVVRMDPDRLKDPAALRAAGLDPGDRRVAMVPWFVERMVGLPRHRAIHSGGFVLSEKPIGEVCPVEWASMPGRSILQWEKDDLATLGLVKFDLLGLGMLTVISKHLKLIEKHRGTKLDLWQLPHEDPEVFDMICEADTIGLFQIESRAQMNTLPRLRPRQFYDLVVEVALIRPGPIQGEMVHPYLRRRRGEEPIDYLHPDLEPHLARTLGVPLFQEQGMKIAIEIGGFSPDEADQLRRAMAHKRSRKAMNELGEKLISRMIARGYGEDIAVRIVKQLTAFADYGFPESHAASFAILVWASAYLKYHFGPEFFAAILNSQPMGFYSASTLVEDAKRHRVIVRPPCVVASEWDCTLEPISPLSWDASTPPVEPFAMRVGLRYVRGLGDRTKPQIERALKPKSISQFVHRSGLDEGQLLSLAHAGAFDALEPERRRAVWEVMRLARGHAGPLDLPGIERDAPHLPVQTPPEIVAADFKRVGLTPREHPMAFLRGELDARGVVSALALPKCLRRQVRVAGLVICRQRPATAKGFVFITLEDEGGMINVIVEPKTFERDRRLIVGHAALEIEGVLQRDQNVINVKAVSIAPISLPWADGHRSHDFH
ncbi:MAG: PHP domain-containing protein [Polyangiales bacterium]